MLKTSGTVIRRAERRTLIEAVADVPCGAGRQLLASFRFQRTSGDQTVAVRFCQRGPGNAPVACSERVPGAGACQARADALLSSMERDLANTLLSAVEPDAPGWRGDLSISSVLALIRLAPLKPGGERSMFPGTDTTRRSALVAKVDGHGATAASAAGGSATALEAANAVGAASVIGTIRTRARPSRR